MISAIVSTAFPTSEFSSQSGRSVFVIYSRGCYFFIPYSHKCFKMQQRTCVQTWQLARNMYLFSFLWLYWSDNKKIKIYKKLQNERSIKKEPNVSSPTRRNLLMLQEPMREFRLWLPWCDKDMDWQKGVQNKRMITWTQYLDLQVLFTIKQSLSQERESRRILVRNWIWEAMNLEMPGMR